MNEIAVLKSELNKIKERNFRVESDKAWETSWARKIIITIISNPFVNALIPAIAFLLSTLTIPIFKKLWLKYIYK